MAAALAAGRRVLTGKIGGSNMNLSDSKKKLALAGVICGLVAACLAFLGNPANMEIGRAHV